MLRFSGGCVCCFYGFFICSGRVFSGGVEDRGGRSLLVEGVLFFGVGLRRYLVEGVY